MIKPTPYSVGCDDCNWSKSFAPQSDAIMPGERPKQCPGCGSEHITYKPIDGMLSQLAKLLKVR